MKSSISIIFLVICTVVLAAQQSQAKKGCNAYGHACYGGHGKRSLNAFVNGDRGSSNSAAGATSLNGNELEDMRQEALLQVFPNEAAAALLAEGRSIDDAYPRYRLIQLMKSWLNSHPRRLVDPRLNEPDYSSGESSSNTNN